MLSVSTKSFESFSLLKTMMGLCLILSQVACSSSASNPSSQSAPSPTNPGPSTPLSSHYYVYSSTDISGSHKIAGYELDASNLTATAIAGGPFAAPTSLRSLCSTSDGQFLYGIDGNTTLSAFQIDTSTGALSAAHTPTYVVGSSAENIHCYKVGTSEFLYMSLPWADRIAVYQINSSNGDLTQVSGSPFATVGISAAGGVCTPFDFTMTSDHKFLYAACENQGNDVNESVVGFSVNADGGLSVLAGSPWAGFSGSQIYGIAASPDGKSLYSFGVWGPLEFWTIATNGNLTYSGSSPINYASLSSLSRGLVDPSGEFIYVLDPDVGNNSAGLGVVSRNTTSGVPSTSIVSTAVTGGTWGVMDMDVDGKFLAVSTSDLHVYGRNSSTGVVSEISGSPFTGKSTNSGLVLVKIQR